MHIDSNQEAKILRERRVWSNKTKITVWGTLIMVFIGSLLIFYSKLPADNNATEEGGLDVSSGFVDQNLYGSLVFSAQLNEASSSERQFYRYDFAEERVSVYLQENVQNENITKKVQWIGEGSDASSSYDRIIVVDKETGSSEFLSTDDVINEADLVVSPDGTHVAYSYQTAGVTDSSSIANWNVAVRNILTGETRTVPTSAISMTNPLIP